MNTVYNPKLKNFARKLRQEMTQEERKLWYTFLKKIPLTVQRQKPIKNYIVDFYIAKAKLIIELDGTQHYEEQGACKDKIRDGVLTSMGYTVLRYTNLEIAKNFPMVCAEIENKIAAFL